MSRRAELIVELDRLRAPPPRILGVQRVGESNWQYTERLRREREDRQTQRALAIAEVEAELAALKEPQHD